MTVRRYIVLGIGIGLFTLVIGLILGRDLAGILISIRDQAITGSSLGILADIIGNPLIWLMQNPIIGAIIVAFIWPALLIWLVLLFLMVLIGFGSGAIRDLDASVRLFGV